MARILTEEIRPGLVVFLNDECIRAESDCKNSAWRSPGRSESTKGNHYFLILSEEDQEGFWLAVHLHSKPMTNRKLMIGKKTGYIDQWSENPSYYYIREFWKLTTSAIVRSSEVDGSPYGRRRYYADGDPGEIETIVGWHRRNHNSFHIAEPEGKAGL